MFLRVLSHDERLGKEHKVNERIKITGPDKIFTQSTFVSQLA